WQDVPGVSGLSATVDWRDGVATVDLDSHQLTLYPEKWLKDAVFFDSVSGQLRWQQDLNWQVELSALQLWNDDFTLQLDGHLKHDNGVTDSDITVKLDQVEISRWQHYVPQSILDEDFKEWANPAFVAGKVVDGDIRLTGNIAEFPFDAKPEQGQFEMKLNVEGVQLHYAPDWPDLVDLTGTITGKNNLLNIQSKHGHIAGFNFAEVNTKINRYLKGKPILTTNGLLTGTTQQALGFLQNSPLKQRFSKVAEVITAEGDSDITLALMVPLADTDNAEASGHVSFKHSQLINPEFPQLKLSEIEGALQFNNNGVSAQGITAILLDQAVSINVVPEKTETVIDITGEFATINLNNMWKNSLPDYISGQAAYQARLSVYEKTLGEFEIDVAVESDLKGINVDMPLPLGKNQDQILPFSVAIKHHGDELSYAAKYGKNINAIVVPSTNANWRGEIRLGKGKAILPKSGMVIKGQLDEISIDDWLSWQEKQSVNTDSSALAYIDTISMNIGQLNAYQQQITGIAFTAERAAQDWRISLHSDQVKGNVNWPHKFDSATPIIMDFDHVYLQMPKTDTQVINAAQESSQKTDLWPSINFHTQRLEVDDMKFGEINFLATRHETSWDVDAAILKSASINASIKGQWQQLPTGEQSHFKLSAASDDFRSLLADLGYQQVMEADNVDIKMDLSWPNSPVDFSRSNIVGQLTMDVGKGRMIDVEPGAAGRIFGLLSVATIPRRLALDFTDLFGKGFSFDSINGSFGLSNGTAYTDDLSMKGSSATIDVVGPVNLIEKTYDQTIKITPNVASTLPVAGAAVGGPIGLGVGTAILIFDKLVGELFDKQIVNLISYSYNLTGPWDEPQLNIVNPISN
ncbi:TIGR02099 family protein, partial [Methylophaga sp. 42_8_T64]